MIHEFLTEMQSFHQPSQASGQPSYHLSSMRLPNHVSIHSSVPRTLMYHRPKANHSIAQGASKIHHATQEPNAASRRLRGYIRSLSFRRPCCISLALASLAFRFTWRGRQPSFQPAPTPKEHQTSQLGWEA